jgi:hypothetical protein
VTTPVKVAKMPCAHAAVAKKAKRETQSSSLTIFVMVGPPPAKRFSKVERPQFARPCKPLSSKFWVPENKISIG